jgi:hypothetical protein
MNSFAHDFMVKGFRRMSDLDRKNSTRPVITRGRHLEQMDWHQLPLRSSQTLVSDSGAFYFIVGYSMVGNGDVVRP